MKFEMRIASIFNLGLLFTGEILTFHIFVLKYPSILFDMDCESLSGEIWTQGRLRPIRLNLG